MPDLMQQVLDQLAQTNRRLRALETLEYPTATGGGTPPSSGDDPPANPDPMDDEFDGVSLDPKWTAFPSTTFSSLAVADGRLTMVFANTGTAYCGIEQPAPSRPWRFRAKMITSHNGSRERHSGLYVRDTYTTRVLSCGPGDHAASGGFCNSGSLSSPIITAGPIWPVVYVEMELPASGEPIWRISPSGEEGSFVAVGIGTTVGAYRWVGVGGLITGEWSGLRTPRICEWFRRMA